MGLISASGENVLFCRDGTLVVESTISGHVQEFKLLAPVLFISKHYLVDAEKHLHVFDGSGLTCVLKLPRGVFCLVEHEGAVYVADRFGDVHRVKDGRSEYVLGTLSYLTGMVVHNDKIVLGDKYGRIRISRMDGKVLEYRFAQEPIVSLVCVGNLLVSVSNGAVVLYDEEYSAAHRFGLPQDTKVVKAISKEEGRLIVICSDSYFLFEIIEVGIRLISHVQEAVLDGACSRSVFYKVKPDLTVTDEAGRVFCK